MTFVKVPFDIQHRTKSLSDIKSWKAFGFKLFFFHVAPLVFYFVPIEKVSFKSFMTLCLAIRLLSNAKNKQYDTDEADVLIEQFFENFVDLYGEDSQSFNSHTMRHLSEQVKRIGPLWFSSAFCFEFANHCLLSAVRGWLVGGFCVLGGWVFGGCGFLVVGFCLLGGWVFRWVEFGLWYVCSGFRWLCFGWVLGGWVLGGCVSSIGWLVFRWVGFGFW